MKKHIIAIIPAFLVLLSLGCDSRLPSESDIPEEETGVIQLRVTWPHNQYAGKPAAVEAVTKISAIVNDESGKELTRTNLRQEGTRGKAELTVEAGNNYQVVLTAFDSDLIKFIGSDDDVDLAPGETETADITMTSAAPDLNASLTGNGSVTFTWSTAPFATGYIVQKGSDTAFLSAEEVYNGSELSWILTDFQNTSYFRIASVTPYGNTTWSNTVSLAPGENSTILVDILWPDDGGGQPLVDKVELALAEVYSTTYQASTSTSLGTCTIGLEVMNTGTVDASNIYVYIAILGTSGGYLSEAEGTLDSIKAGFSKGIRLTSKDAVFTSSSLKPSKVGSISYTLSCDQGGPYKGKLQ